jgi:hypothetical protein
MGIYDSGSIFGIQMYNFNNDDLSNILFEETYNEVMTYNQMREVYLFYTNLNNKNEIRLKYYTECSNTLSYNRENCMMWYPMTLNVFLEKFGDINIKNT